MSMGSDVSKPVRLKSERSKTEHRAFFGRKSGKRLHGGQQQLFDNLLPQLRVELPEGKVFSPKNIFGRAGRKKILEIGYGGGEHLTRQALKNPDDDFIGCEVFRGGIGKILKKIDAENIPNISLFTEDAYLLLKALPDASIDACYLLYPDPWPKLRHHKRRFISAITLQELARVIIPGGLFYFASDIEDYANWTLAHMLHQPDFEWKISSKPQFWHIPFAGWQPTRYEAKARREGREQSFYFSFTRALPAKVPLMFSSPSA
ncbi:MAG: tRNA (guanosine(46)-N7)-methyltransferase TrmB [Devosiaceae bacterium]|nr:tRNA (guanosine(46)-N7)-methyltransferase TrmB [Devosiaceae bacterium]